MDYRFLEAAKAGDSDTVQVVLRLSIKTPAARPRVVPSVTALVSLSPQQLCTPQNVNCRDLEGRHSTPLHFAAGYNRVAVVEYLLHHGADVHAKDKGYRTHTAPPTPPHTFSPAPRRPNISV